MERHNSQRAIIGIFVLITILAFIFHVLPIIIKYNPTLPGSTFTENREKQVSNGNDTTTIVKPHARRSVHRYVGLKSSVPACNKTKFCKTRYEILNASF